MQAGLVKPSVSIGNSALPSGCFGTSDISKGQLFGWEAITTFVLVMTVFAVASTVLIHSCPEFVKFSTKTQLPAASTACPAPRSSSGRECSPANLLFLCTLPGLPTRSFTGLPVLLLKKGSKTSNWSGMIQLGGAGTDVSLL